MVGYIGYHFGWCPFLRKIQVLKNSCVASKALKQNINKGKEIVAVNLRNLGHWSKEKLNFRVKVQFWQHKVDIYRLVKIRSFKVDRKGGINSKSS